ncbi:MAG: HypC/HybG/HupF family hydrogenase formation chaperone [Patescibacteria group bacterium]|nr:HypC/HybG/HupF family hydrogenase formation chaperone [Patescibacteria group bacterium]
MCVATPMKIKEIKDMIAIVEHDGADFRVSLQLVPKAKVGDWILAHGEIAINTIPENEALDILKLVQKSSCSTGR